VLQVVIIHLLAFVQDKETGATIKVRLRALNTQLDVSDWCSMGFGASSSSVYHLVSTVVHIGQSIKGEHKLLLVSAACEVFAWHGPPSSQCCILHSMLGTRCSRQ
jgi:hypothetical protein